jgi:hypothetical protein
MVQASFRDFPLNFFKFLCYVVVEIKFKGFYAVNAKNLPSSCANSSRLQMHLKSVGNTVLFPPIGKGGRSTVTVYW